MNILCIGDIVGRPGRELLAQRLSDIKKEHAIDFVMVNGENAASGMGILPRHADEILALGVDVITLGDHVWDKKEICPYLEESGKIVRPLNFPEGAPGRGWQIIQSGPFKVGVINLLGRTFMRYNVDCPFKALDRAYQEISQITPLILLDMHAETTSEKTAMGHYADGRLSVVVGTHTHIQTADETILPKGTAYITDLGMSGPYDSVIGQNKNIIIQRFLTSFPAKFEVAESGAKICGIIVSVDDQTGKASRIRRLQQA